jgi:hypothetical protein
MLNECPTVTILPTLAILTGICCCNKSNKQENCPRTNMTHFHFLFADDTMEFLNQENFIFLQHL